MAVAAARNETKHKRQSRRRGARLELERAAAQVRGDLDALLDEECLRLGVEVPIVVIVQCTMQCKFKFKCKCNSMWCKCNNMWCKCSSMCCAMFYLLRRRGTSAALLQQVCAEESIARQGIQLSTRQLNHQAKQTRGGETQPSRRHPDRRRRVVTARRDPTRRPTGRSDSGEDLSTFPSSPPRYEKSARTPRRNEIAASFVSHARSLDMVERGTVVTVEVAACRCVTRGGLTRCST